MMTVSFHFAKLDALLSHLEDAIWGWSLIILILLVGIWISVRTGFVQLRYALKALKLAVKTDDNGAGEVSSFAAFCTMLSATIGTGNIVGVAMAIALGGPGALLWMQIASFFGMATKYAEGVLAVKFRTRTHNGRYLGGPFMYIEKGMGKKWRWLARLFAVFGVLAGLFGIGTITQSNSIVKTISGCFETESVWLEIAIAFIVTVLASVVLLGGTKRIASVSQMLMPIITILYLFLCLIVVFSHVHELPAILRMIFRYAFEPSAAVGAVGGITVKGAMQLGVSRGIFSNEAGLGSAPIAAAAAKCDQPAKQGLVAMASTMIDTNVVCTLTGLTVLLTGAWQQPGLEGAGITDYAWRAGLPILGEGVSSVLLTICLCGFAFTTIIGWNFYAERCLEYLYNGQRKAILLFRIGYIIAVALGPFLSIASVWRIANICNGLMAFPNLFAILILSGVVTRETKKFAGEERFLPPNNKNH